MAGGANSARNAAAAASASTGGGAATASKECGGVTSATLRARAAAQHLQGLWRRKHLLARAPLEGRGWVLQHVPRRADAAKVSRMVAPIKAVR